MAGVRIHLIVEFCMNIPSFHRSRHETDLGIVSVWLSPIATSVLQSVYRRWAIKDVPVRVINRNHRPTLTTQIIVQIVSKT